jgi:hypothetical protein
MESVELRIMRSSRMQAALRVEARKAKVIEGATASEKETFSH